MSVERTITLAAKLLCPPDEDWDLATEPVKSLSFRLMCAVKHTLVRRADALGEMLPKASKSYHYWYRRRDAMLAWFDWGPAITKNPL